MFVMVAVVAAASMSQCMKMWSPNAGVSLIVIALLIAFCSLYWAEPVKEIVLLVPHP